MALLDPVAQLTNAQRTRRVARYLVLYASHTVKHLLLIAIASRQYLNLIHWLPVILSFQRVVLFPNNDGAGGVSDQIGVENGYELVQQSEDEPGDRLEQTSSEYPQLYISALSRHRVRGSTSCNPSSSIHRDVDM